MRMQVAQRIFTCTGFSKSLNTSPRKENQGKGLLLHQSIDPKICLTETEKKMQQTRIFLLWNDGNIADWTLVFLKQPLLDAGLVITVTAL